jgi:hypothetical protein
MATGLTRLAACILLGNYVSTYMPKSYPDTCVVTGNVTLSHATVSRIEQSRFFYMNRDPKLKPEVLNRDNNC